MQNAAIVNRDVHRQFAELLAQHRRLVFKIVNAYARTQADREDLAQEIAIQTWRAFPSYDAARSFSTWLYRIALNVAISHVRQTSQRRYTVPLDVEHHEMPAPADNEEPGAQGVLSAFMAELDPLNRALLVLYLEERSYREMAEILGISETNVSTKINRLKQRVRRFGETHGAR